MASGSSKEYNKSSGSSDDMNEEGATGIGTAKIFKETTDVISQPSTSFVNRATNITPTKDDDVSTNPEQVTGDATENSSESDLCLSYTSDVPSTWSGIIVQVFGTREKKSLHEDGAAERGNSGSNTPTTGEDVSANPDQVTDGATDPTDDDVSANPDQVTDGATPTTDDDLSMNPDQATDGATDPTDHDVSANPDQVTDGATPTTDDDLSMNPDQATDGATDPTDHDVSANPDQVTDGATPTTDDDLSMNPDQATGATDPTDDDVSMNPDQATGGATHTTVDDVSMNPDQATDDDVSMNLEQATGMRKKQPLHEGGATERDNCNESENTTDIILQAVSISPIDCADSSTTTTADHMSAKLDQIVDMMNKQSLRIDGLMADVANMSYLNPKRYYADLCSQLEVRLEQISKNFLERCENQLREDEATFTTACVIDFDEMRDSFTKILDTQLTKCLMESCKEASLELQRQLMPMIDTMRCQILKGWSQKFVEFEQEVKKQTNEICISPTTTNTITKSILQSTNDSMQAEFSETMLNTIMPAYQDSSEMCFQKLNDAFAVEIRECVNQMQTSLQQYRPVQIQGEVTTFFEQLNTLITQHCNTITDTLSVNRSSVMGLTMTLPQKIKETVQSELLQCIKNETAKEHPENIKPNPQLDTKTIIRQHLHNGLISRAFDHALRANDLNLVQFTLENADYSLVFSPKCCLEQKLILSLIQQIGVDMRNHNALKQRYLADSLQAIDFNDPITRQYAPQVLQELHRNCSNFLKHYPENPQCSSVHRMLNLTLSDFKM